MSEAATSYAFESLEPSGPLPGDAVGRLLAQAGAEAEEMRAQAREEGLAEGRVAGYQEGRAQVSSAAATLREAARQLEELRESAVAALERDAIELSLSLAEKILAGAIAVRRELVVDVVRGALRRVGDGQSVTLLVSPDDVELVRAALAHADEVDPRKADGQGVPRSRVDQLCEVQADPRVPPGGAVARTEKGEVDAGVHTQLERAREAIMAELGEGG